MKKDLFPQRLMLLRHEHNVTQEELGEVLGVSKGSVSKYEKGTAKPTYKNLWELADYFNVSVDYLIGKSDAFQADPVDQEFINEVVSLFDELDHEQKESMLEFLKKLKDSDLLFELQKVFDPLNSEQREKMLRLFLFLQKNDF